MRNFNQRENLAAAYHLRGLLDAEGDLIASTLCMNDDADDRRNHRDWQAWLARQPEHVHAFLRDRLAEDARENARHAAEQRAMRRVKASPVFAAEYQRLRAEGRRVGNAVKWATRHTAAELAIGENLVELDEATAAAIEAERRVERADDRRGHGPMDPDTRRRMFGRGR